MAKIDDIQALTKPAAITTQKKKPSSRVQVIRLHKGVIVEKVRRRGSPDPVQPHNGGQAKAPQSAKVFRLLISSIQILGRAYDSRHVDDLAQSMYVAGQRTPITVWLSDGSEGVPAGLYVLIDGHHELEAAKVNGWPDIDCVLVQGTLSDLRRRHIEDRLFQARLNKLIRSELIAVWVRLTDGSSGQVDQKSGPGRPSGGLAKAARVLTVLGKTEEACRKAVERAIRIDQISAEAKTAAINAGFADNQRALLAVANETTPEAQLSKVQELGASKRAKLKQNSSPAVGGIDGETPVPATPASAPVDATNTRTEPDGDEHGPAPAGGIDGETPVAGSPTSTPVDSPTGPELDGDGLMTEWQNAEAFRHAWGNAPVTVREKFFSEVMQAYRE